MNYDELEQLDNNADGYLAQHYETVMLKLKVAQVIELKNLVYQLAIVAERLIKDGQ